MKTLIFRIGTMGDTLVALPAFSAIRKAFPLDELILLTAHEKEPVNFAPLLLTRTGLVDRVIEYQSGIKGLAIVGEVLKLRRRIRTEGIERLIYLPPGLRTRAQAERDARFFQWAGIRKILGIREFVPCLVRDAKGHLNRLPKETQWLLSHLARCGISTEGAFEGLAEKLGMGGTATMDVIPPSKTVVAFCPGGKRTAQKWALQNYRDLGRRLISSHDIEPVVVGGPEDSKSAQDLIGFWGRGMHFCGKADIFETAKIMKRAVLYIGNDTGPMHLAAFLGVPCVAIFSARNNPGIWEPWGEGHTVLRQSVPCEGCELTDCKFDDHPCLSRICVEEVFEAVSKYLDRTPLP